MLADLDEPAAAGDGGMPPSSRPTAWAIGLLVPVSALACYLCVGNLEGLQPRSPPGAAAGAHALNPAQVTAMAERLAARLANEPNDLDGWLMLARSNIAIGRFQDAARAYARATALRPGDAQLLADYADTMAMAQGRKLEGEPEKLIGLALAADPRHPKALALAGSAAFARRDFASAIRYWQRIVEIAPPESELARSAQGSIADAERRLAGGDATATRPTAPRITGRVTLDPRLAARIAPDDTVFVFARAAEGPRMPLVMLRRRASELPLEIVLDDSLALDPSRKLSSVDRVVVLARVSRSGSAAVQAGDLEGASEPVRLGARRLDIAIDRIVR